MQITSRRLSASGDSGVEMPHSRTLPQPHVQATYQSQQQQQQQTPRHPAAYPEDDPSLYRGELDGLMKQQNSTYQRQRQIYPVIILKNFYKHSID